MAPTPTSPNVAGGAENAHFCLWAIVDESPKSWEIESEQEQDGRQPYVLKKCEFDTQTQQSPAGSDTVLWEDVQSATSATAMDSFLFNYADFEAVKNRIFDCNNYSFDVVNRAVQVFLFHFLRIIILNNRLSAVKKRS